jgi:hypothetical protein
MKKEFIPYEQALELKELGFQEECLKQYSLHYDNEDKVLSLQLYDSSDFIVTSSENYPVKAPLYQQAFRFFREKYKIDSWISINLQAATNYSFSILDGSHLGKWITNLTTQEDAQLECLKKLIEIAKNK